MATLEPLWTAAMPFSLVGSMAPVCDPDSDSVFVSDGWGTAYAAIRLRRLALATGEEKASARLGEGAGCVFFSADGRTVVAATGKRLLAFDRGSLEEVGRWTSKVPRYAFYGALMGRRAALMNWRGPSLGLYDLDESRCQRVRVGSCNGLFPVSDSGLMVCSGKEGRVSVVDVADGRVATILETPRFLRAHHCSARSFLVLVIGDPFECTDASVRHFHDSRLLRIHSLSGAGGFDELRLPRSFGLSALSEDATRLYLADASSVMTCTLDGSRIARMREGTLPPRLEVAAFVPERSIAIAVSHDRQRKRSSLYALKLE